MKLKSIYLVILVAAFSICSCQANTVETNSAKTNSTSTEGGSGSINNDSNTNSSGEELSEKSNSLPENSVSPNEKNSEKGKIETIYTDLDEKTCKTIDSNEQEEWIVQECPGVAGYKLEVTEGDLRQTINVIAPSGGKYELDFQRNVSQAFSYLGKKAEWRVKKVGDKITPIALIVRFNASEDPEDSEKVTSYLVVTKFEGEFVCITDVVKPIKNANEKARELADASAGKSCLKGN